jgi:hypothetical protein
VTNCAKRPFLSAAVIAGRLAEWLASDGFAVTVIERAVSV